MSKGIPGLHINGETSDGIWERQNTNVSYSNPYSSSPGNIIKIAPFKSRILPSDSVKNISYRIERKLQGVSNLCISLPKGLQDIRSYISHEVQVGQGWALASILASLGMALQGTVQVQCAEHFFVPVLPAFILLGARGTGKSRTIQLATKPLQDPMSPLVSPIISNGGSLIQVISQVFEKGGFGAIADGEFAIIKNLYAYPNFREPIVNLLDGKSEGYKSARYDYTMKNASLAFLCGVQPDVFRGYAKKYKMEETGLLSRCTFINVCNDAISDTIPQSAFQNYETIIYRLMTDSQERKTNNKILKLSFLPDAKYAFQAFIDSNPILDGTLAEGWLYRAPQLIASLAAIISLYDSLDAKYISLGNITLAIELIKWLYEENRIAYDYLYPSQEMDNALTIANCLVRLPFPYISGQFILKKDLHKLLLSDIPKKLEFEIGLSVLLRFDVIQEASGLSWNGRHAPGYSFSVEHLNNFILKHTLPY